MADIINLQGMETEVPKVDEVCKIVLEDLNNNLNKIKDLYVFFKTEDDLINIIHTDVSFKDRSVMLQLLQHHITQDLLEAEDIFEDIEPNL
jgi:hypothetical protein